MLTQDPTVLDFHLFGKALTVTAWTLAAMVPAQTLFTARTLVQWGLSEKHKTCVTPRSYWWMSLAATVLMIAYSLHREEIPFLLGFAINLLPYTRNLMLSYRLTKGAGPTGVGLCIAGLACIVVLVAKQKMAAVDGWLAFGLVGAVVFNSRFLLQWYQSERLGRSEFTLPFWYTSLAGALMLLVYSFIRGDVGYIVAYMFNAVPYVRNIMLIRKRAWEQGGSPEE